jgi:hypothetical protein
MRAEERKPYVDSLQGRVEIFYRRLVRSLRRIGAGSIALVIGGLGASALLAGTLTLPTTPDQEIFTAPAEPNTLPDEFFRDQTPADEGAIEVAEVSEGQGDRGPAGSTDAAPVEAPLLGDAPLSEEVFGPDLGEVGGETVVDLAQAASEAGGSPFGEGPAALGNSLGLHDFVDLAGGTSTGPASVDIPALDGSVGTLTPDTVIEVLETETLGLGISDMGVETPDLGVPDAAIPDAGIEVPDLGVPDAGIEVPDTGAEETIEGSGVEVPDLGVPDAGIEVPDLGVPDAGIEVPDAGAEGTVEGSGVEASDAPVEDSGVEASDAPVEDSGVEAPETGTVDSGVEAPETGAVDAGAEDKDEGMWVATSAALPMPDDPSDEPGADEDADIGNMEPSVSQDTSTAEADPIPEATARSSP